MTFPKGLGLGCRKGFNDIQCYLKLFDHRTIFHTYSYPQELVVPRVPLQKIFLDKHHAKYLLSSSFLNEELPDAKHE